MALHNPAEDRLRDAARKKRARSSIKSGTTRPKAAGRTRTGSTGRIRRTRRQLGGGRSPTRRAGPIRGATPFKLPTRSISRKRR